MSMNRVQDGGCLEEDAVVRESQDAITLIFQVARAYLIVFVF